MQFKSATHPALLFLILGGLALLAPAEANGHSSRSAGESKAGARPAAVALSLSQLAQQQPVTPTTSSEIILAPGYTENNTPLILARPSGAQPAESGQAGSALPAAGQAFFDFGAPTAPTEPGWRQVTTDTLYSTDAGYGWLALNPDLLAQDQGVRDALLRDYVTGVQPATLRVDLSPGVYEVWVAVHNEERRVPLMTLRAATLTANALNFSVPMPRSGGGGAFGSVGFDPSLTAVAGFPTYDYKWNVVVTGTFLDITLSAAAGSWQINALAIRRQQSTLDPKYAYEAQVTLSGQELPPSQELQTQIPDRFWYNSLLTGDAGKDWQYMLQWRDQYIDPANTPAQNMRALLPAIRSLTGAAVRGNHPVDTIAHGGWCTGLSWLTIMAAWSLGLPARSIDLFTDGGIDVAAFLPPDPFGMMSGSSHTVAEVYMDGDWHMIDLGWERPGSAMDYLDSLAPYGALAQWHITGARELVYEVWDGTARYRVVYSPATAPLLYPDSVQHPFRLTTHDPRTPRLLRFDSAVDYDPARIRLTPGDWIEKRFWLPPVKEDVERVVTRIPLLQDYEGTPTVSNWTLKVNGRNYLLGKANLDWQADAGHMLAVELARADLRAGWNTLRLGAATANPDEALFVATSYDRTTSQSSVIDNGNVAAPVGNPVWFIDWEFVDTLDALPPNQVQDLRANGWRSGGLEVQWTIPGDDGPVGRATSFEVRYHDEPINLNNWSIATLAVAAPYTATGAIQQAILPGLRAETRYYLAVMSFDEGGRSSRLSRVLTVYAYDRNGNPHYYASSNSVYTAKLTDLAAQVVFSDALYTAVEAQVAVQVVNQGPSVADRITVALQLESGAQLLATPDNCLLDGASGLLCQATDVAPNAPFTIPLALLTDHAGAPDPGALSLKLAVLGGDYDPVAENNTVTRQIALIPRADLGLAHAGAAGPLVAGAVYTYALQISNPGPDASTGVTFTFRPDPAIQITQVQAPGFTCSGGDAPTLTCTSSSLPVNATADVEIVTRVDAAAQDFASSTATLSAATADLNSANNTLTFTQALSMEADVAVQASMNPETVVGQTQITTTIGVSNRGPSIAPGTVLTISMKGLHCPRVAGDWQCTRSDSQENYTCVTPVLAAGQTSRFELTCDPGIGTVQGEVQSAVYDPLPGNNRVDLGIKASRVYLPIVGKE